MLHPPRASHLTADKRQEEVQDCGQRHKTNGVPGGRASPTRLFILIGAEEEPGLLGVKLHHLLVAWFLLQKMHPLMNKTCPVRSLAPTDGIRL